MLSGSAEVRQMAFHSTPASVLTPGFFLRAEFADFTNVNYPWVPRPAGVQSVHRMSPGRAAVLSCRPVCVAGDRVLAERGVGCSLGGKRTRELRPGAHSAFPLP